MAPLRAAAAALCLVAAAPAGAYYLPGSFPNEYKEGQALAVKVNSLTSTQTELPYMFYNAGLPFCRPQGGVKEAAENLGEILLGDRIESSPYVFHMLSPQHAAHLCTAEFTGAQLADLATKVGDKYRVNMILDNMPVTTQDLELGTGDVSTGFPLGYTTKDGKTYIYNHLHFRVLVNEVVLSPSAAAARVMVSMDGGSMPVNFFRGAGALTGGQGAGVVGDAANATGTGYMVVGFEVVPCSIARGAPAEGTPMYAEVEPPEGQAEAGGACGGAPMEVTPPPRGEITNSTPVAVEFTYGVSWEKTDVQWASRWDAYLTMQGSQVHWFSIMNSFMVVCFLSGVVGVILLKTVRSDLKRYEELLAEPPEAAREDAGWKLVAGDVFRPPPRAARLALYTGSGVHIAAVAAVTVVFAALGFMSPAARGSLLTSAIVVYLALGSVAGYAAVRTLGLISGSTAAWRPLSWHVACLFPGLIFVVTACINAAIVSTGSSGAIPFAVFVEVTLLWFAISAPMTVAGGYAAHRAGPPPAPPVRPNQIPRQIPEQKVHPLPLVLGAGILPFGTMFIELYFIMSSIWLHRTYYVFGFLLVVGIFLVVICAEVAAVVTYVQLCTEDYRWWWRSFLASGSAAVYAGLYAVLYFFLDLHHLRKGGTAALVMYFGYNILCVAAIYLGCGAVGFLASYWFVHTIFSSVKLE